MKRTPRSDKPGGFLPVSPSEPIRTLGGLKTPGGVRDKAPSSLERLKAKYEKIIREMEQLHLHNEKADREIRAIRHKLMATRNLADLLQTLIEELGRRNVDHVSLALDMETVSPDGPAGANLPFEIRKHLLFFPRSDLEKTLSPAGRPQTRIGARDKVDLLGIFGHRTRSCVMAPMVFRGRVIGSVNLGAVSATRFSDDMVPDLLEDLAQTAALCLDNAITHERNEQLAATDALTGIHNRRYFYETAARTVALANRHGDWISCIFIDLNDFKKINDTHGHKVGDLALTKLVHYIRGRIRQTDLFARLGGDEFALILPRIAPADAERLAETLRSGLARIAFEEKELETLTLSAAFGVTGLKGGQIRLEDLIARADEAMYADKAKKPRNI